MKKIKKTLAALCASLVAVSSNIAVIPNASAEFMTVYKRYLNEDYTAYSLQDAQLQFSFVTAKELLNQTDEETDANIAFKRLREEFGAFGRPVDDEMNERYKQFLIDKGYNFPKIQASLAEALAQGSKEEIVFITLYTDVSRQYFQKCREYFIEWGCTEEEADEICRYSDTALEYYQNTLREKYPDEEEFQKAIKKYPLDTVSVWDDMYMKDTEKIISEARLNELTYVNYDESYNNGVFFIDATAEQINKIAELDVVQSINIPVESEPEWYFEAFTENNLMGDANLDGEVNIADATAIIQAIGNPDKYGLSINGAILADCYNTGDGVTGLDALEIQIKLANPEG